MSEERSIPVELTKFEAAVRRPLMQRYRYALVRTHNPVLDDAARTSSN
jgi:hypothetical protein